MLCTFEVDGDPRARWTEQRDDLPLYQGSNIPHIGHFYEIVDEPRYVADWESASISANFVVKQAPTHRR
jgi:hypothetical protein